MNFADATSEPQLGRENNLLSCSANQFRGPYESFQQEFFPLLFLRQRRLWDTHRFLQRGETLNLLSPLQRKRAQSRLFEAPVAVGGAAEQLLNAPQISPLFSRSDSYVAEISIRCSEGLFCAYVFRRLLMLSIENSAVRVA